MTKPVRLQLSRKRGFDLQALSRATNGLECVNIARPGKWGNPFTVEQAEEAGYTDGRSMAVYGFRQFLANDPLFCSRPPLIEARRRILDGLQELRGRNIACWCRPSEACHGDVYLEIANSPAPETDG